MAPFKQARLMSVVLLFATLAAGILIGVAWSERGSDTAAVPMDEVEPAPQTPDAEDADDPDPDGGRVRRRPVIFELDLDSAQLARLDGQRQYLIQQSEVLDEEMQALSDEIRRRQRELRRAAWDSIRAVLRPEQTARYDSLLTARFSRGDSTRSDGDRGNSRDRGRRPDSPDRSWRPFLSPLSPQHGKDQ